MTWLTIQAGDVREGDTLLISGHPAEVWAVQPMRSGRVRIEFSGAAEDMRIVPADAVMTILDVVAA